MSPKIWNTTYLLEIMIVQMTSSEHMSCNLGESVVSRTCGIFSVFYLIDALVRRGTFCWKYHLNRTSGSKVKQLKDSKNNRKQKKWIPFQAVSHNQLVRKVRQIQIALKSFIWAFLTPLLHSMVFCKKQTNKQTNKTKTNKQTNKKKHTFCCQYWGVRTF